jgi:SAM-dependent methyltransferase
LSAAIPWWAKIAVKLVLSRLPVSSRTWQRAGLFSPGEMRDADYALAVFDRHFETAGRPPPGFAFLELGPGDSFSSAIIGHAMGAARCWLVDSGAYASRDVTVYGGLTERIRARGGAQREVSISDADGASEILSRCGATYLEGGLRSLTQVPDGSCDFVFSQAVLEHVAKADFASVLGEIHRILKPGGVTSHNVDFQDHLGGSLNNLRFSERLWEAPWFARRSGFYTNRLRLSQMLAIFRETGFEVGALQTDKWPKLPLPKEAIDPDFRAFTADDLCTFHAFIGLTKPIDP